MTAERRLHHFAFDPYSRQVRLALGEKKLPFVETVVRYWERPEAFEALNPSLVPPVLVDDLDGRRVVVAETRAILEHLEEQYRERPLLAEDPTERAEARRLQQWFDRKFDFEVNAFLVHEKIEKRLLGLGAIDLAALRRGREVLREHFQYFERLLGERDWFAGDRMSLADITAAGHVSIIDYLGEAPWQNFPHTKLWYMKFKSRPCFRPLLEDKLPGVPPSTHYQELDF